MEEDKKIREKRGRGGRKIIVVIVYRCSCIVRFVNFGFLIYIFDFIIIFLGVVCREKNLIKYMFIKFYK